MTPHKHAEVIKAWADGAQIQTKSATGEWIDFDNPSPSWAAAEYRVKPEAPSKVYPATQMTNQDFAATLGCGGSFNLTGCRDIANAAIRHAIDSGQVCLPDETVEVYPLGYREKRDMAIALAVRSAMLHAAYTIPGMDALDLTAIIATVKEP